MDKIPAPKLSVVVPVYNVEHYLRDALMSLLNQTFTGFELIAINDGSTDGSRAILSEMAHSDHRIHFIEQKNRGLAATRNRGLAESRGEYIYFFDSDDLLEGNAFYKMISYTENRSVDVLNIGSEAIDDKGKAANIVTPMQFDQPRPVTGEELFIRLYRSGNYPANVQKYMYRKDFLTDNRLKFDEGFIHEDEAFSLKALCLARKAGALPDRFLKKRFRSDSLMSSNKSKKNVEGWAKAVSNLLEFKGEHNLRPATKKLLDKRVFQLSKNIINLYNQLIEKKEPMPPLGDFLPPKMLFSKNIMLALKICSYRILVSAKRMRHNVSEINRD